MFLEFPACAARNCLYTSEKGLRVNFSTLYASFNQLEIVRWNKESHHLPADEFGIFPFGVEEFLNSLTNKEIDMTVETAGPKRKSSAKGAAPKSRAAKKAVAGTIGKVAGAKDKPLRTTMDETKAADEATVKAKKGNAKFDADQTVIPELEQEKIPGLDTAIKQLLQEERKVENAKSAIDVIRDKYTKLMHANGLKEYSCNSVQLIEVPGTPKILVKRIKDK